MNGQDEIFDVVDVDDNVIGQATRQECHSDASLIHRTVHVIVYAYNHLLIQLRSPSKDQLPNYWDISVGGHLNQGESYLSAAVRECKEELGILVDDKALTPMGKILYKSDRETEYSQVYMIEYSGPFNFCPNEISKIQWLNYLVPSQFSEPMTPALLKESAILAKFEHTFVFRVCQVCSQLHKQSLALRNEFLRKPIGLEMTQDEIEMETDHLHYCITQKDCVVASVSFLPLTDKTYQLRQMIVHPEQQGIGLGKQIVKFAESQIQFLSVEKVILHARIPAIPFYEKLGYKTNGKIFIEVGIEHINMVKHLK
ncbi:MAG: GNAT family N-acetyltransferase [Lentisphaeria bacterium]|nr:GNAT family N-acetyltransferase [Lentisphaeria bacterium]